MSLFVLNMTWQYLSCTSIFSFTHSISIRIYFIFTWSSGSARICVTVPLAFALTLYSIFMLSTEIKTSPCSTFYPTSQKILTTRPGIGLMTWPALPPPPPGPPAVPNIPAPNLLSSKLLSTSISSSMLPSSSLSVSNAPLAWPSSSCYFMNSSTMSCNATTGIMLHLASSSEGSPLLLNCLMPRRLLMLL